MYTISLIYILFHFGTESWHSGEQEENLTITIKES